MNDLISEVTSHVYLKPQPAQRWEVNITPPPSSLIFAITHEPRKLSTRNLRSDFFCINLTHAVDILAKSVLKKWKK